MKCLTSETFSGNANKLSSTINLTTKKNDTYF